MHAFHPMYSSKWTHALFYSDSKAYGRSFNHFATQLEALNLKKNKNDGGRDDVGHYDCKSSNNFISWLVSWMRLAANTNGNSPKDPPNSSIRSITSSRKWIYLLAVSQALRKSSMHVITEVQVLIRWGYILNTTHVSPVEKAVTNPVRRTDSVRAGRNLQAKVYRTGGEFILVIFYIFCWVNW